MKFLIVPTAEQHLPALYEVINAVAREGRYLAFTELPPWGQSLAYYRALLSGDFPFFVALDGENVVGWCDVAPLMGQSRAHIGTLGLGVRADLRHQGLGARLLSAAIEKSWARGLTRIELTVRDDNLNARALYERMGFEHEGVNRRGSVIGSACHDVFAMALLR
ncbi:GNAT family protein [soil metagenome]